MGFGGLALAGLSAKWAAAETARQGAPTLHFAPRAKRVIFFFMDGGVSQVDSFDPKPELTKQSGQPANWKPDPLSQAVSAGRKWLGSPWKFQQYGQSGLWVSDLFPQAAKVIDELCVIRSLTGETPLHGAERSSCTPAVRSPPRRAWDPGFRMDWAGRTNSFRVMCS